MNFEFFWCSLAQPSFTVDGVTIDPNSENLFNKERISKAGNTVSVEDPIYGTTLTPGVFTFKGDEKDIDIAIHEVSNCVYVAYAKSDDLPFCCPRYQWDNRHRDSSYIRRKGTALLSILYFVLLYAGNYPFEGGTFIIRGEHSPTAMNILSAFIIAPFAVLYGYLKALFLRKSRKKKINQYANSVPSTRLGEKTVETSKERLRITTPMMELSSKGVLIDSVVETDNFVFIIAGKEWQIAIPKEAIEAAGGKETFLSEIQELRNETP